MKKLIFILVLALSRILSHAQPGFNKVYVNGGGDNGTSVLPINGGYIICGSGYSTIYDGWVSVKIFKTDSAGNLQWLKEIGQTSFGYDCGFQGSFIQLSDGNYAFGGGAVDSSGALGQAILCKVDTSGDTIWLRRFGIDAYDNFQQTKQTSDNGFISVGWKANELPSPFTFYAVKTDSNGNLLWDSTYGNTGAAEGGNTVEQTPDNGFIMAGSNSVGTNGESQPFVIKTDSNGKVQWQQVYDKPDAGNGPAAVTQSRFGGYYMWGYMDTFGNSQQEYLNKLDSGGNIVWRHFFNSPLNTFIGQVREIADSTVVVVGGKPLAGQNGDEGGWIVKLNDQGNEIWNRYYPGDYVNNGIFTYLDALFYDFQSTPDKGFIITGTLNDSTTNDTTYNQDFWLVKTDSMGCVNGDCGYEGINTISVSPQNELKIYPNPAYSSVTIEWQATAVLYAVVAIYDVVGREISSQQINSGKAQINVSGLENGLYVVKVMSPSGGGGGGGIFSSAKLAVLK